MLKFMKCVQEKQRAEAAAKKLEAKKMAEEEAAQLASSAKKAASASKVQAFTFCVLCSPLQIEMPGREERLLQMNLQCPWSTVG